jgi:hypothetical protein
LQFLHWRVCRRWSITKVSTPLTNTSIRRDVPGLDADLSSWKQGSGNNSFDSPSVAMTGLQGTDDIHLFTHYYPPDPAFENVVENTPVMYAQTGDSNPGILGIGSSSTLLAGLVKQGAIAAKTLSLYIGTGSMRAGGVINGSTTFGGFDSGRFTGPVYSYPMDLKSAEFLPVQVSDIILDDPSSSTVHKLSIMDDQPFQARLTTDRYPMMLPYEVTQKFMSTLSAEPSNMTDGSLRATKPFNGTMTIMLSNGFNVTLPGEVVANVSGLTPVAAQDQNYTGPYYLSESWLGQVYLMMDFEKEQFHMAQIRNDDAYVIPTTMCPGDMPVPHNYNSPRSFGQRGLIGAVIGGIIGGAALAVLGWILYLWWRSERQDSFATGYQGVKEAMINDDDMEMQKLSPVPPGMQRTWAPVPIAPPKSPRSISPVSSVSSMGSDGGFRRPVTP